MRCSSPGWRPSGRAPCPLGEVPPDCVAHAASRSMAKKGKSLILILLLLLSLNQKTLDRSYDSNPRMQLNQYWRDQRAEIRRARVRSELRLVGREVFLSNPQLLRQVKSWIDIAGVDYARKTLSETGVADPHIDTIIEAALSRKMKNAQNGTTICAS